MDCPATVQHVQARFLRDLTSHEQTVAGTLLVDAWADLRAILPTLVDRLSATDPAPPPDLLPQTIRALAEAVKRVLLNPYGRKQESRAIDDANRSWTLSDTVASGALYFTDTELDALRDPATTTMRMGKAFTVMPTSPVVIDDTSWVPLPWTW